MFIFFLRVNLYREFEPGNLELGRIDVTVLRLHLNILLNLVQNIVDNHSDSLGWISGDLDEFLVNKSNGVFYKDCWSM